MLTSIPITSIPYRNPKLIVIISVPYSLLPVPYSLLPTPYSLLPTPYSLLPAPFVIKSINQIL
ncbi:MAG: hypothetical protein F6K50_23840 [Moorea sp. SIO3I7]|nr:hypothetical protein [Moorena sp. SIO3I7]